MKYAQGLRKFFYILLGGGGSFCRLRRAIWNGRSKFMARVPPAMARSGLVASKASTHASPANLRNTWSSSCRPSRVSCESTCRCIRTHRRGMFPMLVGQYTNYLQKQIAAYLEANRPHDEEGAKTESCTP